MRDVHWFTGLQSRTCLPKVYNLLLTVSWPHISCEWRLWSLNDSQSYVGKNSQLPQFCKHLLCFYFHLIFVYAILWIFCLSKCALKWEKWKTRDILSFFKVHLLSLWILMVPGKSGLTNNFFQRHQICLDLVFYSFFIYLFCS